MSMQGVTFHGCNLTDTTFDSADLEGASFKRSHGDGTTFRGSRLVDVSLADGSFTNLTADDCQLLGIDTTGATLDDISRANLRG